MWVESAVNHEAKRVYQVISSGAFCCLVAGSMPGFIFVLSNRQVAEAEKVRHGQKAATVTGLKNESTGDIVDMDVPARRCALP